MTSHHTTSLITGWFFFNQFQNIGAHFLLRLRGRRRNRFEAEQILVIALVQFAQTIDFIHRKATAFLFAFVGATV